MNTTYYEDDENIKAVEEIRVKKSIVVIIAILFCFLSTNTLYAAANTWTQRADFGGIARLYAVGFSIGNKGHIGTGGSHEEFLGLTE